jgi:undecaprenyl-diphosphatase
MTDSFRETLEDQAFGAPYRAPASHRIPANGIGLLLAFSLSAGSLYWLAVTVLSGRSLAFDSALLLHIHAFEPVRFVHFANAVCVLVTVFSVLMLAYLCWQRRWTSALFWFGSTAGASILCGIAKKLMERHRPELWALATKHASFSFPSGHATQSMAFVVALLLLAPAAKRKTILALGLPWIALVALCRLYLGLHYPTDIVAGWALAAAWCCLLGLLRLPNAASR